MKISKEVRNITIRNFEYSVEELEKRYHSFLLSFSLDSIATAISYLEHSCSIPDALKTLKAVKFSECFFDMTEKDLKSIDVFPVLFFEVVEEHYKLGKQMIFTDNFVENSYVTIVDESEDNEVLFHFCVNEASW